YSEANNGVLKSNIKQRFQRTYCSKPPTKESNGVPYVVTNWILYYLFRFGSLLGHEVFYITFLPCIFWNVDPFIGRKMITVWVVTMYIGQALKDLIKWPRPTWPPAFKLETRVEAEFGLPSTHAIAGTALPFSLLMAMNGRYIFPWELGVVLACLWCALVSFSRIYLGMHSYLDVIGGVALTAAYLTIGWPFMELVDEYTLTTKFAPWIIIMSHFLLGVIYPNTDRYSTSRGDTIIILGVGAGCHCASWWHYQYGFYFEPTASLPYQLSLPTFDMLCMSIMRAVLGCLLTILIRFLMKFVSLYIVCHAVGVSKDDPGARQRKDVEVAYKFTTYTGVTFFALGIVPVVFRLINLT
uniref:Phosphatidic acid phosphatase type 2/haloperoxidase domain-containing protein n=1 Tax=Ciona savignyi TaxID=51511 RepID=H2Y802_CIOSA